MGLKEPPLLSSADQAVEQTTKSVKASKITKSPATLVGGNTEILPSALNCTFMKILKADGMSSFETPKGFKLLARLIKQLGW